PPRGGADPEPLLLPRVEPGHRDGDLVCGFWGQARIDGTSRARDVGWGESLGALALAWERWGPSTPAHLPGEYAAVGWEPAARRLWAIRDPFGVEPLYFSETRHGVAVSNLPGVAMSAPGASAELDGVGVLDHLLFDGPAEPEGTLWRCLRRLPPGAVTSWVADPSAAGGWRREETRTSAPLAAGPTAVPSTPAAVVDRFADLLETAVAERLPARGGVAVSMSGGLDSVAVAALACRLPEARQAGLSAHTLVYRSLLADLEGPPARGAASALDLPHGCFAMDPYPSFAGWRQLPMGPVPGEPMADAIYHDFDLSVLARGSVILSGWGGDPLLLPERRWWRAHAVRHGWWSALLSGWSAFRTTGRRPPLGIHGAWQRRIESRGSPALPPWLGVDPARRSRALERLECRLRGAASGPASEPDAGGFRPTALRHTLDSGWGHLFERIHWGVRGLRLLRRHPFFDPRVASFALSLPTLPWCLEKHLLRKLLEGRVPAAVWQRPKTPQGGDPRHPVEERPRDLWRTWLEGAPELEEYLDTAAVGTWLGTGEGRAPTHASPWRPALALACWLYRLRQQGPGNLEAARPVEPRPIRASVSGKLCTSVPAKVC
ncbi:MAG: asparagine synthase-related protein, partial [Holophagales bacterium]|nr:asparagine synthase-related protein [Holophagales bacterium]